MRSRNLDTCKLRIGEAAHYPRAVKLSHDNSEKGSLSSFAFQGLNLARARIWPHLTVKCDLALTHKFGVLILYDI